MEWRGKLVLIQSSLSQRASSQQHLDCDRLDAFLRQFPATAMSFRRWRRRNWIGELNSIIGHWHMPSLFFLFESGWPDHWVVERVLVDESAAAWELFFAFGDEELFSFSTSAWDITTTMRTHFMHTFSSSLNLLSVMRWKHGKCQLFSGRWSGEGKKKLKNRRKRCQVSIFTSSSDVEWC